MSLKIYNTCINSAQRTLDKARQRRDAVVVREQKTCKHPQIAEADYQPSSYGSATPPWRICLNCGLTEEGWGVGWTVLKAPEHQVGRISRSALMRLRQGSTIAHWNSERPK